MVRSLVAAIAIWILEDRLCLVASVILYTNADRRVSGDTAESIEITALDFDSYTGG
jgi:hypothetical protein